MQYLGRKARATGENDGIVGSRAKKGCTIPANADSWGRRKSGGLDWVFLWSRGYSAWMDENGWAPAGQAILLVVLLAVVCFSALRLDYMCCWIYGSRR